MLIITATTYGSWRSKHHKGEQGLQDFFPGGWGCPGQQKLCPSPTNQLPSPLFDQSLFPQLIFVPENFKNFTSFFSQFCLLFSSELHQKALFYALNTRICSNFVVGRYFWPQWSIFPRPLIWLRLLVYPFPIWLCPKQGPEIVLESKPPTKI